MVRSTFTREFKFDLCRRVVAGEVSKSQIKRENSIGNATLDRWVEQYMALGDEAFQGEAWRPHRDGPLARVRELEAALGRAHLEIEFLKECLGNLPRLRAKKRP
ncbi:MAG: transposase [Armatimonadetes bacterium]|nr:transposase [Armatimonadota bacterium]